MTDTTISIVVSALALYLAGMEGQWQRARRRQGQLWFPAGVFIRYAYIAGTLLYTAMIVLPGTRWVTNSGGWVTDAGFLALMALTISTWPTSILLDREGVTELRWGGLRRRRCIWSDVLHAVRIETDREREVQLILKAGSPIVHTAIHIDRDRFINEVQKYVEIFGGPPREL